MKFRPELFWDTKPEKIDPEKNARYIIERILDFGRDEEVRWLWHRYDHQLIRKVVDESRSLQARTKALWTLLLPDTSKSSRRRPAAGAQFPNYLAGGEEVV